MKYQFIHSVLRLREYIRVLFSVHYCSSSCWRLCLESLAYGIALCRGSCIDGRIRGIVNGKVEEVVKGVEAKGLRVNAW